MNIAFRVDASSLIGTGHVMRCLTLASILRKSGAHVRFVSRHLPEYFRETLGEQGYETVVINSWPIEGLTDDLVHASWLATSQQADAQDTVQALSDRAWDWLIVDHYSLDARWEMQLRGTAKHILVIDDLADRSHECDALLDQNFYADMDARYIGRVPAHCHLLLGPRYVLLREEFQQFRKCVKIRTGPVERLLVFFGGVDAGNYTSRVIEALTTLAITDLRVDIVIGIQHPFRQQILSDCSRLGFSCHLQTSRMAQLMANADLAIGACGLTSYEFAAMLLPAILIPVTDIQAAVVAGFSKKGISYALFPMGKEIVEVISEALTTIVGSDLYRSSMSLACSYFVDADGAGRVAKEIVEVRGQQ